MKRRSKTDNRNFFDIPVKPGSVQNDKSKFIKIKKYYMFYHENKIINISAYSKQDIARHYKLKEAYIIRKCRKVDRIEEHKLDLNLCL